MTDEPRNSANKGRNRGPKPDQREGKCRLDRFGDIAAMALLDDDAPPEVNPVSRYCEKHFHTLVETMAEGLALTDVGGQIVYVNRQLVQMSGYGAEELMGRNVRNFFPARALAPFEDILAGRYGGPNRSFEIAWAGKDGRRNFSRLSPQPLFDEDDRFCGALIVVTDITAQKNVERILREREKELQRKNDHLEEVNTALQTLVKIREIDKTELEETVVANIHQLADPLLVRLKASGLNERQKSYVAILEANLHEVITPFVQQIATRYLELTTAEVEVANLVKHGRKSKEIASLLNISTRTVEMHRRNIRKKLGLRNKHANLRTFLLSKSTA